MDGMVREETLRIHGSLALSRMGAAVICAVLLLFNNSCAPWQTALLIGLLLTMGLLPLLTYLLRREWLVHPQSAKILMGMDLLGISLVALLASQFEVPPVFFLYYYLLAGEAACWWGRAGALSVPVLGGALMTLFYLGTRMPLHDWSVAMAALNMAVSTYAALLVTWSVKQWRENRRMSHWLRDQQGRVSQINDQLHGWQEVYEALQKTESPHDLLELALREAMRLSGSPLGMAVLRDPYSQGLRAECWQGFALADPERATLQAGDKLPLLTGEGWIEVGDVRGAVLRVAPPAASGVGGDLGQLIVARPKGSSYQDSDGQWMEILATFVAALMENRFLRRQIGRVQEEADSVLRAGWTLAALPDPAAAMEMACKHVLSTWDLDEVMIFLYGRETERGCQVVVYTAQAPAQTTTMPLLGRGLRLLRRFLDGGTSMIFNRRSEWPELFDLMSWTEVQAVACFPLYVLGHRWGALCLLARKPDAFPPQTQQNLAIFSGEIAMALENYYLRQAIDGSES